MERAGGRSWAHSARRGRSRSELDQDAGMEAVDRPRSDVVGRIAPGVAALRTYRASLAPLRPRGRASSSPRSSCPQGMAYAELAGVPAVTGLYTTIFCLVGYALVGPSRVLVLGPDSSVSPLIFAAIVPLVVADDPAQAITLAGHAGPHRRAHRDPARHRQARLRGRPPVEGGAGRLHERPGRHDHRRPAPEALRLLHRCRRLHRRAAGVRRAASTSGTRPPSRWASAPSPCCSCCPASCRRSLPSSSPSSGPRS